MNPRVLRRFILLMFVLMFVVFLGTDVLCGFLDRAPGDYHTEVGSNRLQEGEYEEALKHFNLALEEAPNHRGALMGRAIVFTQTERYEDALAEYDFLIRYLSETLEPDDATGRGVLAAAYANRGIVYDRTRRYKKALDDYIKALKTDADAVEEPGLVHKILYGNPNPSSVRKRARYLYEQLQKPPEERLMRVPEIDARQRMYKP
jgi:tetratricopeptide (TPR) repeat protein